MYFLKIRDYQIRIFKYPAVSLFSKDTHWPNHAES